MIIEWLMKEMEHPRRRTGWTILSILIITLVTFVCWKTSPWWVGLIIVAVAIASTGLIVLALAWILGPIEENNKEGGEKE